MFAKIEDRKIYDRPRATMQVDLQQKLESNELTAAYEF